MPVADGRDRIYRTPVGSARSPKSCYTYQVCNQESFRAGEVSWNEGTSISILSTTHQRKAPQGKILAFFLLDTLKTGFQTRRLTRAWTHKIFSKIRPLFFRFSERRRRGITPHTAPLPSMCVPAYSSKIFYHEGIFFSDIWVKLLK